LWGGKTKYGVDCSGLVQSIFKTLNIILPRDSKEQSNFGVEIKQGYKLGDLAFFGENVNKISHVGIFIDNETIVHAYGKVRVDKINSKGIYNTEEERITHFLQKVNRIL
jgi:cell wall-associated NlpC family hydrolase